MSERFSSPAGDGRTGAMPEEPLPATTPTRPAVWARRALEQARYDRQALIGACVLGLMIATAALGPVLAPYSPVAQDYSAVLSPPSASHWLGTDDLGRDVLSRLIHGTRVSLQASFLAVAVALIVGVPLGLLSGWAGGWVDSTLMRIVDALLAFPALVLAIGVIGVVGPGLVTAMVAVGLIFSPVMMRLMRAQVLAVKGRLFVDVAQTFGSSNVRIVFRHLLPNSVQPVLVQSALYLAVALLAEASLSFLGLGVQPPQPSWGSMLGSAYRYMGEAPVQMIAPGLAIMVTAWAFNALGDGLRIALDPHEHR